MTQDVPNSFIISFEYRILQIKNVHSRLQIFIEFEKLLIVE